MKSKTKKAQGSNIARRMWVIAAALGALFAVMGAGLAFAADEVAVWHYKITVNSVVSGEAVTPEVPNMPDGSSSGMESLNPLILEFDVNQNVEPIRDTLKASYTWTSKWMMAYMGERLSDSEGHGQGSKLEDWEVVLARHFNPLCHSFFYVDDEWERTFAPEFPRFTYTIPDPGGGSGQGPSPRELWRIRTKAIFKDQEQGDRLVFSIRADYPVTIISNDYLNGATSKETSINSFRDFGEVKYDYRMAKQGMRTEPVSGVYGTGVIIPEVNVSRYTIELDVEQKPVELTLSASPGKGSAIRFSNKITVGGVECSRLFKVHRLERDWFLMEDPQDSGTGSSWEVVNDWHDVTDDGNLAAERDVSFDSFFPPKSPRSAWGDRLYVAEFLDVIERLPELGFLYHVVMLMTSEGGKPSDIDAFAAQEINDEKWCLLFSRTNLPFAGMPLDKKLATKKLP